MTETKVQAQQAALRQDCALLDRSERGKLALTGAEAKAFLNGQVTNDVEALQPGQGQYAALLTHKGKMLADLRVLDLGDELWLDCERVALQPLFDALRRFLVGFDAELHKRTLEQSLLSLVGPRAREIVGAGALPEDEHSNVRSQVGGADVVLVATDIGVDVICAAGAAAAVRDALDCPEIDEAAAEVLRVETGRPRYGVELDDSVIPQEAGLNDRAVSFTKGCYVGQETVARLHYRGKPNRHLRGLRLTGPVHTGDPLRLGEREVGRVASVADSPRFGPIALALVRREAEPGATLDVGGGDARAEVVELPFA
ncbi:MAG TPA: glycine cleavage T C-terminal barrel domain-containing protein [Solirubrobacteraceae bacterium]|jgi:folate-binding protein YgfZ